MSNILRSLNSPDEKERIFAIQDIGASNDTKFTIPLLNRMELEESRAVRDAILFCLKNMKCSNIYTQLFDLFRSTDAYLRNAAVVIFGTEGEESIAFLATHLDDADKEVRKLILDSLYETKSHDAILAIRAGLHDHSQNVKITAVEYLGLLSDKESVDEMLELLQNDAEPMLTTTILESIRQIGDKQAIRRTLAIIMPDGIAESVDPLFLPEIMRLLSKTGDLETNCNFIYSIEDPEVYAEDIMQAIGEIKQRFGQIVQEKRIIDTIIAIIKNDQVQSDVRYTAIEFIINDNLLNANELYELGSFLLNDKSMNYGSVRLLGTSNIDEALKEIKIIADETKEHQLLELCAEFLD